MAETTQSLIVLPAPALAAPEAVPQIAGAGPVWRSLLFPRKGQRAIELGDDGSRLFASLRLAGVQVERWGASGGPTEEASFDLVLDDRTNGHSAVRTGRIRSLLVPGGRWVLVLGGGRWVGWSGLRAPRLARREGFETIETFYAYPSIRQPRILVPLDQPEPFRYFLNLAVGAHGPRQRLLSLAARCLCALRLHRWFLPNLIVVARRER